MVNFVKNSNHTCLSKHTHTHKDTQKKQQPFGICTNFAKLIVDLVRNDDDFLILCTLSHVHCSSSSFHFQFFNFCSILHNIIFSCWFLFSFYFNSFEVIIIIIILIVTAVWIAQKAFKSTKQLHHLIVTFVYSLSIKHICTAWLFAGAVCSRVIVSLLQ